MTALQIGCLAANVPARHFYEAIGGRLVGERLFDEEGVMLPLCRDSQIGLVGSSLSGFRTSMVRIIAL